MRSYSISVFIFLFYLSGMAQKAQTYKVIIYPANERNSIIYDLSDKHSFCNLVSQYIKQNHGPYFRDLQLMFTEEALFLAKDYKGVKIETVQSDGYIPESYFFSPQMDLYIFQQKDSTANIFRDIRYEFRIKGQTQYEEVIGLSVADLNTNSLFNVKSITGNSKLFSLEDEYSFDEEKTRQSFSYYFINKMDLDVLRMNPPVQVRIKQYLGNEMKEATKYQQYLIEDLKKLYQTGALKLKTKYDVNFNDLDSSYGRNPFRYSMPGPLLNLISISGEDSVITLPNGDQLVQYHPRKEFDLQSKHLLGVQLYERGTFDTESKTWVYQPYAISPIFIVDGQHVKDEYDQYWILLSNIQAIQDQVNESTYWWFKSIQKLHGGKMLFQFEPRIPVTY